MLRTFKMEAENNEKIEDKLLNDYMDYLQNQESLSQAMSFRESDRTQAEMSEAFSQMSTQEHGVSDSEMQSQQSQKSENKEGMSM